MLNSFGSPACGRSRRKREFVNYISGFFYKALLVMAVGLLKNQAALGNE
jgi:hypothetical protein